MPSMEDLQKVMDGPDKLGAAYIPFTFPTVTVRTNMKAVGVEASNADVDRLWEAYYVLQTEKGFKPYAGPSGSGALVNALRAATNLPLNTVAAWLNATLKAVNEQNMGWRWIDPAASDHAEQGTLKTVATQIGDAAGALLKPSLDPVTNLVKYTAVAVAAGAVIYGIFHGVRIYKTMKRGKRRKKGG